MLNLIANTMTMAGALGEFRGVRGLRRKGDGSALEMVGESQEALRTMYEDGELRELTIDAVVFKSQYPNANFYHFRIEDLPAMARSFAEIPFLQDHNERTIDARLGVVESGRYEGDELVTAIRLTSDAGLRAYFEGRVDRFSISIFYSGTTCSVCGNDWQDYHECMHWPGRTYEYEGADGVTRELLCEIIFDDPTGREVSAVNVPAVAGTGLLEVGPDGEGDITMAGLQDMKEEGEGLVDAAAETAAEIVAYPTPGASLAGEVAGEMSDWLKVARDSGRDAMLASSRLSAPAQAAVLRMVGDHYTPASLQEAIDVQRAVLAAEREAQGGVVTGHRVLDAGGMLAPEDRAAEAVDWMFGVDGAQSPGYGLMKPAELYVWITGDRSLSGKFDGELAQMANANTSTFGGMTRNSLNKKIEAHFAAMMTYKWFESIVDVVPHDGSSQPIDMVVVDGMANLPIVAEAGPYTEAKSGDSREVMSFKKRGYYVGITLEMIKRSEMSRLRAIPMSIVMSCLRTRSNSVAELFTQASGTGPTMTDDSKKLFHTDHGNLGTNAFGMSGWKANRNRIWSQTVPGTSKPFGLWPRFVLLPADTYDDALSLFGYGRGIDQGMPSSGGSAQVPNPYAEDRPNDMRPMPLAVPEFTDTNDWAVITHPAEFTPIKMAYDHAPEGRMHPPPELFEVTDPNSGLMFTNDVMPLKVRDWYSVGVSTFVGVGKNNVA